MRRRFPKPRLAVLTLVALVAVLAAGYAVLVKPQRRDASALAAQIESVQAQLDAAQAAGSGAQGDVAPIRVADLFRLSRAMPDKPDLPDVLLQLSQISTETGVTFKAITPSDPVTTATYEQLPIDLVFEGHFYDLADFLYRVRNLVGVHDGRLDATGRLYSIDSISFDEGQVKFPQVEAKLRVDAYVFGDGTSDAATTPPATAGATQ
jgi:Tfp pilus assembly protein PilO